MSEPTKLTAKGGSTTAKGNAVTAITRALDEARLRTSMSPFVIEGLLVHALEELAQVHELMRPRRVKAVKGPVAP